MNTDVAAQAASATAIQGMSDEILTFIGKLQSDVEALQPQWKGAAQVAFVGGSTEIHAQLQKGQIAVQETAEKVAKSGTTYSSTDETSAAALGNTGL
ncbi:hypothetical protein EB74_30040 [Mycobacterium sp. SWH-M5]|nr:hypothetical protein EB74_30040 [Mycobacterium sp. SWH-M5]